MDFELTEEHRMVQEMTRSFAEREIKPVASPMDHDGIYPAELVKELGGIGLMGVFAPQEYGGAGMDFVSYIIAMEEISKVWASLSAIMSVNNSLVCAPILRYGSAAQISDICHWLPAARSPDVTPDRTNVRFRRGFHPNPGQGVSDGYLLNGAKVFTTNGSCAELAIVYAVTDPNRGKQGISAFLVERRSPGFIVGRIEDKLGLRASETAQLIFENCHISEETLLGREGEGFNIALETLDSGRIGIAAQAPASRKDVSKNPSAYSQQRRQFGHAIANFQAIQAMLADMATEIDCARLLTYRAAWLINSGGK